MMEIETEQQNQIALEEVDRLWNAARGSPEGDRLEELVDAIVAFEKAHYPMEPLTAEVWAEYCLDQFGEIRPMPGGD